MQHAQEQVRNFAYYGFQPPAGSLLLKNREHDGADVLNSLHAIRRRSERDVQLIRAGDAAAPLLTILSGWAFRFSMLPNGRRQILGIYLPGDTIGLDTLLTGSPAYPVQCAGSVTYSVISHSQAAVLAAEAPWFQRQALDALARDRAGAVAALTRLGQCNAEERLASVFLELHERLASRGLAGNGSFILELTQQQLADLVGLNAVHLNRVLQRLKARKLVALSGHRVTLLDMGSLECLALRPSPATALRQAS